MTTSGGGWTLFGDLTDSSNHFDGSRYLGFFDEGEAEIEGYSLDINKLHRSEDELFDVMIQYGEEDILQPCQRRVSKSRRFLSNPTKFIDLWFDGKRYCRWILFKLLCR